MSTKAANEMLAKMESYFDKVKQAIATGGAASFRYTTGSIPANGSIVYDAPTELGFVVANYQVYSLGIQLSIVDPTVSSNPPVTGAESVLKYEIQPDGKVKISNNYSSAVTYHARFTMPVKK